MAGGPLLETDERRSSRRLAMSRKSDSLFMPLTSATIVRNVSSTYPRSQHQHRTSAIQHVDTTKLFECCTILWAATGKAVGQIRAQRPGP